MKIFALILAISAAIVSVASICYSTYVYIQARKRSAAEWEERLKKHDRTALKIKKEEEQSL
jgi:hypothetical protein